MEASIHRNCVDIGMCFSFMSETRKLTVSILNIDNDNNNMWGCPYELYIVDHHDRMPQS
jgi:hypothetical protein